MSHIDERSPAPVEPDAAEEPPTAVRSPAGRWVDLGALLLCLVAIPAVHTIGPVFHEGYTQDEAWVAVATKARLGDITWVTASTPYGWTMLVRLLPVPVDSLRVLAMLFLAASVLAGYALGRTAGWRSRGEAVLAGLVCAAAVILLPAGQLRHDLKQYTADAAFALVLLVLVARVEADWSRRRVAVLAATTVGATLFSHTAFLVGGAMFGGLVVVALVRRAGRQLLDLVLCGAATLVGLGTVYLVLDRPRQTPELADFWVLYFPHVRGLPHYLALRLHELTPVLGLPWELLFVLAAAGVVTLVRLGRPATAAGALLLPVGAVVAGVAHLYPLLDLRTSYFLCVAAAALAGLGVTGVAVAVGRLADPGSGHRRRWVAAVLAVVALGGYATANAPWLRYPAVNYLWSARVPGQPPPPLPVPARAEVRYVAEHHRPGDMVAVNLPDQFTFALYWNADAPVFNRGGAHSIGWTITYRPAAGVLVAADRTEDAVRTILAEARREVAPGGRVWLVRSHMTPGDTKAWDDALADLGVTSTPVGPAGLSILTPS